MALSRIRATVYLASAQVVNTSAETGTAALASVQSIHPVASVAAAIPFADIKWVNIVYAAEVDYRGLNPVIHELQVVVDLARVSFGKNLTETQDASDYFHPWVFNKGLTETQHVADARAFSLSRSIADVVDATDDFQGSANIDDDQVMVYGKATTDAVVKSDVASRSAGKNLTDSIASSDVRTSAFAKAATDPVASSDSTTAEFSKTVADTIDAGDEFNATALTDDGEVMIFGKTVYDTFVQTDDAVVEAGKAFGDSATTGDELLPFELGKGIEDTPETSEQQIFVFGAVRVDAFSQTDAASVTYSKPVFDDTNYPADGPNQYDTYALSYFLEDYVREGFPALDFTKFLEDAVDATDDFFGVANTDDDQTTSFSKFLQHSAISSDAATVASSKALADAASSSELLTYAAGKALADSFHSTELPTFGLDKTLPPDATTTSEIVVRSAGKGVYDTALSAESTTFTLSKTLVDTVTPTDDWLGVANADDDETMELHKVVSDPVSKSDSTSLTPGKGLNHPVATSESGSIVWTDYWDINYTVTTSGLYVGNSQTF